MHFQAQARKIKTIHVEKNSLYFGKLNGNPETLQKFLTF